MSFSARCSAVCVVLVSSLALAEPDAGVEEAQADDSASTSQVASFATTKLKDSPAVVTVISSQDIKESGARDLVDILQLVPGLFLAADVQGVVGAGFRGLWGYEGKILLMIDGKEMNELLYLTMQLGNEFPVELIERVEVVRGPGSVIYGGIAELAVINVITRSVQGGTDLMVSGSYGQFTEGPSFSSSYARRNIVASGRYVFESVPGLSAFVSGSIGQGQRSSALYTGYDGTSGSSAGASQLDPTVVQAGVGYRDWQATFLYSRMLTSSLAPNGTVVTPILNNFETLAGEIGGTIHISDRFDLTPRFNITQQRPWTDPNMDENYYDKSARRLRARLIARWAPLDWLQLTLGGDAMFDHANLNGATSGTLPGFQTYFGGASQDPCDTCTTGVDYRTFAGFIEAFSENPIVNISIGGRFDYNSYYASKPSFVPRFVLLRSFGPVSLKGLISFAFKWPGIENINLNPDVAPEHTTVYEFEVGVDLNKQSRISLNAFNVGISAPIIYDVSVAGMENYKNYGRQGTTGGELAFRWKNSFLRIDANYSLYVPTLADNVGPYLAPGRPDTFISAPNHHGVLTGSVRPLKWLSISPTVLVFGPRTAIASDDPTQSQTQAIPTQVLANLVVRADDLGVKGLNVSLGVYNVFGVDYHFVQAYSGHNAPMPALGREVLLRIGYTFEPTYD